MGTPVERQNLSFWFFLLSTLIALATLWSVYDEAFARRPWKRYQDKFFEVERTKAERDLAFNKKVLEAKKDELAKLENDRAAAEREVGSPASLELKKQKENLELELFDAKQNIAFAKSDLDAAYYVLRQAREHRNPEELKKAEGELHEVGERIARLQGVLDQKDSALAATNNRIDAQNRKLTDLQAKIDAIRDPVNEAGRKVDAAKEEYSHLEQYWIPKLGKVDRCQNCHMAIDRCGYSEPWEVVEAKNRPNADDATVVKNFCITSGALASYTAIAAAFCEGDPLPDAPAADAVCQDAATLSAWEEISRLYCPGGKPGPRKWWVKDGKACAPKAGVEALTAAAKGKDFDIPYVFRTHPSRDQLLGAVHPAEKFGCTACHGGEGVQTKGVEHQQFDHAEDDPYWEEWQDPLLAKVRIWGKKTDLTAAACNKCHQADNKLAHADMLNRGKKMVVAIGCYGCHPIDGFGDIRKPGPSLTDVKAKVNGPGWLQSWISYPRAFRPRTRMPNFWPEAIDQSTVVPGKSAGEAKKGSREHQLRQDETRFIAAYLWSTSSPPLPDRELPGTAAEGEKLFDSIGCRGCHVAEEGAATRPIEESVDRDFAPNLWNVGAKTNPRWIFMWLKDPKGYWPGTKMPSLRLTDEEAGSLAKWLGAKNPGLKYDVPDGFEDESSEKFKAMASKGKGLISKYGCFGCHDVKGFEDAQRIGADLSDFGTKAVDLLDFGDAITNHLKQNWYNWIDTKLRTPRVYRYERVDTRMPQFDLSDDEVRVLITFLKGQQASKASQIPAEYRAGIDDRRKAVIEGDKLVAMYGCRNCHPVYGEGGRIRDRYNDDTMTTAPPVINNEGMKTQPDWLFHFIKDPGQHIRPWLKVRMPTFGFRDEDATALVKYFSARDGAAWPYITVALPTLTAERDADAHKLFTELKCLSCHTTGAPPPGVSLADLAPDLSLASKRLRPDWIPLWLADPQKQMEGTRMPGFFPEGQTPLPQLFGGDVKEQMKALQDVVIGFGATKEVARAEGKGGKAATPAKPAGKKKKAAAIPAGVKTAAR